MPSQPLRSSSPWFSPAARDAQTEDFPRLVRPALAGERVPTVVGLAHRAVCGGSWNEKRHQQRAWRRSWEVGGAIARSQESGPLPGASTRAPACHRRTVARPEDHSPELEEHAGDQREQCQFADLQLPKRHCVRPVALQECRGRSASNRPPRPAGLNSNEHRGSSVATHGLDRSSTLPSAWLR